MDMGTRLLLRHFAFRWLGTQRDSLTRQRVWHVTVANASIGMLACVDLMPVLGFFFGFVRLRHCGMSKSKSTQITYANTCTCTHTFTHTHIYIYIHLSIYIYICNTVYYDLRSVTHPQAYSMCTHFVVSLLPTTGILSVTVCQVVWVVHFDICSS